MRRFNYLLALLLITGTLCIAQTDPVVEKIIEIGVADNRTMEHLDILSNRFGGRLAGSDAYTNAAGWAASKFSEWGMIVEMDEAGSVPVMTFGLSDPMGYDFQYGEIWHTERDLYNMSIATYQEHTSIVTAVVVYGIANLDHLLPGESYYLD